MKFNSRETDRRKLRWFWISLVLYFSAIVYVLHFASKLPYQILAVGGILNMAVIISFVIAISRLYKRMRESGRPAGDDGASALTKPNRETYSRAISVLWVGLGLYLLIVLNSFRYFQRMRVSLFIAGILVNVAIIAAITLAIIRAYKKLKQ